MREYRVLWLGRPLRFGPWHGYWHKGGEYRWMFDLGPVRVIRVRGGATDA